VSENINEQIIEDLCGRIDIRKILKTFLLCWDSPEKTKVLQDMKDILDPKNK